MADARDAPLGVLHLAGSPVSTFYADLSRLYARDCFEATADPDRYRFHAAYVAPGGTWSFPADLSAAAIADAHPTTPAAALDRIAALEIDVVIPQMFCRPGMTAYRALFDMLGIPYVGNTAATMGIGADKAQARAIVAAAGVDVPAGEVLRDGDAPTLAPPVVVKPVDSDNSLGVSLVRAPGEYPAALAAGFAESDRVLVERYVELGREVRCGIVERDGELVGLPLEEYAVDPVGKPIRPYDDKISRVGASELKLLAKDGERAWIVDPSDPLTGVVHDVARRCHVALGCRQYSLFDFRIDPSGRPFFLEAGLYCSFARTSVIAVMAAAAGIPLPQLFAEMVEQAVSAR